MRLILAAISLAMLVGCDSDPCSNTDMAQIMAQNFVKRELRDPDSAKFTRTAATRDNDDACIYIVKGEFSAANGFGGMTGGVFIVEMRKIRDENSWRAVDLIIE